ncbi:MAG: RAD55 family ATPase [Anaerolineae bacterium]
MNKAGQREGRVPTGIPELDQMLNGGFLPLTANLVEGAPGCGKTTLGMHFIRAGALQGEPGLILTFEQFPEQFYRDAAAFGWDFHVLEDAGLLKVIMSSPAVVKSDWEQLNGRMQNWVQETGCKRVLIDSLSHFERISRTPAVLRSHVYGFLNALKREGVTALLTRESSILLGDEDETTADASLGFLVDSYILLRYVEIESAIRRAIIVLKMRGSRHDTHIRQFDIGPHGIYIRGPFKGREAILSGTPQQMAESFIKAFIRR